VGEGFWDKVNESEGRLSTLHHFRPGTLGDRQNEQTGLTSCRLYVFEQQSRERRSKLVFSSYSSSYKFQNKNHLTDNITFCSNFLTDKTLNSNNDMTFFRDIFGNFSSKMQLYAPAGSRKRRQVLCMQREHLDSAEFRQTPKPHCRNMPYIATLK